MEAFQIIENRYWNNWLSIKKKRYISYVTPFKNILTSFSLGLTQHKPSRQQWGGGGGGHAKETASMAGRWVICRGKGGSIWGMVRAGFSLSEKRVTNMESEKPEMNSVMSDWRNQCKLKVLYVYFLAWTLMVRTLAFQEMHTKVFRGKGFISKYIRCLNEWITKNIQYIYNIYYII